MISERIKEWFLSRTLPNNFDWVKSLPDDELDRQLAVYNPEFHTQPFKHQKAMVLLCLQETCFLLFTDMGSGKTKAILDTIAVRKKQGQVKKSLIIVPDLVNIGNWLEQIEIHRPELKGLKIHGTKKERLELLLEPADLYIINYAGILSILSTPDPNRPRARRIFPQTAVDFASQFQCITLDECVAIKNVQSMTYKVCQLLSLRITYRYGLTGTPFGRQPLDLWAQFFIIDRGATLGKNIYVFRESYFNAKQTFYGVNWRIKKELEPKLHLIIKNRSVRYRSDECSDLPPRVPATGFNRLKCYLSDEAQKYYDQLTGELEKTARDGQWASKIKNSFIKLRQVCSGYLLYKPDGSDENIETDFDDNPKLTFIEQIVDNLPDDCKMIVFHEYTPGGRMVSETLTKMKVRYEWLYGGTKDKLACIQAFQRDKRVRVLVANSHSGAVGLNLQMANYIVFYESPVSPIVRAQAEKRALRTGQTKPVYIYDLMVEDSIEERILDFIKEGQSLWDAILEGRVKITDILYGKSRTAA